MLANLSAHEKKQLTQLSQYKKIQEYLDALAHHNDKRAPDIRSPRWVLHYKKAHCIEGALVAAAALWVHGEQPLIMDLRATKDDDDHVVALFKHKGLWGALSKTRFAVLRYREPVYATPRELAMSYFNEYFLDDGRKTLRSYSDPFDLASLDRDWITAEGHLGWLVRRLDQSAHHEIVPKHLRGNLRAADAMEIKAGKIH